MKKKWIIIQSNRKIGPYGTDDCEFLRECWSLKYAIEQNGDIADVWGLRHDNFSILPTFNDYDYIFVEEQWEFGWVPWQQIKESSAYRIHRWTDINVHPHDYFRHADCFDMILSPSKLVIPELQSRFLESRIVWFPSCMDDRYFKPLNLERVHDVIWLGSHTRKYTAQLEQEIGLRRGMKAGWEYIKELASTKVFLNSREWGRGDIPYKNFEAIGVGTCVVCDYDESYEELGFRNDINCYFFKSYEECKDKILYALSHKRWNRIGQAGLKLAPLHSFTSRILRLKNILDGRIEGINF
jgi:hypothetical protein